MAQKKTKKPASKKAAPSKMGLGRGLSSLMSTREAAYDEVPTTAAKTEPKPAGKELPIEFLVANAYQPRTYFDEAKAQELVDSVKTKGIIQPLLVRPKGKEKFEIVAGERRWRAAQAAGLHQVPVVIKELTDEEALEIAIIENIQRHDLNPIEEALGYKRLMDEFSHTQNALGKAVGKSRSHIANMLRLLSLPETVQNLMQDGALSMGHARALITADDPATLAKLVVKDGLSVRQTEQMAKSHKENGKPAKSAKPAKPFAKDPDLAAFEDELSVAIGLKVELDTQDGESGVLKIHYKSLEQLDDICAKINNDS